MSTYGWSEVMWTPQNLMWKLDFGTQLSNQTFMYSIVAFQLYGKMKTLKNHQNKQFYIVGGIFSRKNIFVVLAIENHKLKKNRIFG